MTYQTTTSKKVSPVNPNPAVTVTVQFNGTKTSSRAELDNFLATVDTVTGSLNLTEADQSFYINQESAELNCDINKTEQSATNITPQPVLPEKPKFPYTVAMSKDSDKSIARHLRQLYDVYNISPFRAADVISLNKNPANEKIQFPTPLLKLLVPNKNMTSRQLGQYYGNIKNRDYSGFTISIQRTTNMGTVWQVIKTKSSKN